MTPVPKDRLRSELRRQRREIPPEQARAAARAAARSASRLGPVVQARRMACYLPRGGELDTGPVIEGAWWRGQAVYLPVLVGQGLAFAPYDPGTPLVANRFGIPEPVVARRHLLRARQLDVVLAPLVAFDGRGHRLGMGGGFYDRALRFRALHRAWRRPWFIGLGYAFQQVSALVPDPWDVDLDAVITERGTCRCRHQE